MEILAAITVSLIVGAVCGTIASRPGMLAALRSDLGQIGLWLFTPIPVTDQEPEYVGRHRIVEEEQTATQPDEIVLGFEFR